MQSQDTEMEMELELKEVPQEEREEYLLFVWSQKDSAFVVAESLQSKETDKVVHQKIEQAQEEENAIEEKNGNATETEEAEGRAALQQLSLDESWAWVGKDEEVAKEWIWIDKDEPISDAPNRAIVIPGLKATTMAAIEAFFPGFAVGAYMAGGTVYSIYSQPVWWLGFAPIRSWVPTSTWLTNCIKAAVSGGVMGGAVSSATVLVVGTGVILTTAGLYHAFRLYLKARKHCA